MQRQGIGESGHRESGHREPRHWESGHGETVHGETRNREAGHGEVCALSIVLVPPLIYILFQMNQYLVHSSVQRSGQ